MLQALSKDVQVELLGVIDYGQKNPQWWRPDGSPLDEPPCHSIDVDIDAYIKQGSTPYAFAFRIIGADYPSVRIRFSDSGVGSHLCQPKDDKGRIIDQQHVVVALFSPNAVPKQIDISIGISIEPWRILATYKPGYTWPYTYDDGGVVFHPPYEEDGKLVINVCHTDHEPYRELRLVAYDRQNKLHGQISSTSASTSGFVSSRYEFEKSSLVDVDRFELRAKSYEWAIFRRVSLKPGNITQPTGEALLHPHDQVGRIAPEDKNPATDLIGQKVKPFELPGVDGKRYRLSAYEGKPIVICVFATYCGPCRAEMPDLARLSKEIEAKGCAVLAISHGESIETVREFVRKNRISFPVLVDKDTDVTKHFAHTKSVPLPTNLLLDREHRIIYATTVLTRERFSALGRAIESLLGTNIYSTRSGSLEPPSK